MKERVERIRQLLNELEDEIGAGAASAGDHYFSALELPLIIQEIVDDLQRSCHPTKPRSIGTPFVIPLPRTARPTYGSAELCDVEV